MVRRSRLAILPLALACGRPAALEEPLSDWACANVSLGTLIDVGQTPSEAPDIEVGRAAYRVNVLPAEPGYLRLVLDEDTELRLLADEPDAVVAVWTGPDDERMAVELVEGPPACPERTLFGADLVLFAGDVTLEVGPTLQANVWLAVATP
ncbi:MAG: hypothetical protein AAF211_01705 [Myxococcota bacterium]